jgi:hypothetical protein
MVPAVGDLFELIIDIWRYIRYNDTINHRKEHPHEKQNDF